MGPRFPGGGTAALFLFWRWFWVDGTFVDRCAAAVFCAALLWAAVTDVRSLKVPNAAVALALAAALVRRAGSMGSFLEGLLVCGGIMLLVHARGLVGAGDVKLSAAVGAYLGAACGAAALVIASVLSAATAALVMLKKGGLGGWVRLNAAALVFGPKPLVDAIPAEERLYLPKAPFLLCGALGASAAARLLSLC